MISLHKKFYQFTKFFLFVYNLLINKYYKQTFIFLKNTCLNIFDKKINKLHTSFFDIKGSFISFFSSYSYFNKRYYTWAFYDIFLELLYGVYWDYKFFESFMLGTITYKWVWVYRNFHSYISFNRNIIRFVGAKTNLFFKNNIFQFNYLYIYSIVKTFFLPFFLSIFFFFLLFDYFSVDLDDHLEIWIVVLLLFFWMITEFNSFLRQYRFGKFTSSIQRFWKRANSYFWLIEGFLFSLFFYYYLNSSQEPIYMFDESNLNQDFLTNLPSFYYSYILLVFCIFYSYYLLLNINNLNFNQKIFHLFLSTLALLFIFLVESYQFYYVLTVFYENTFIFTAENNLWSIAVDNPKIRAKQQYLILALIAKYWHFLFIFFSWLFFIFKVYEQKKIYYPLFGLNIQNFVILFILNILFNVGWLKWIIRRFYDLYYFWFFTNFNETNFYMYNNEIFNFFI